jgi:hypothetical protein
MQDADAASAEVPWAYITFAYCDVRMFNMLGLLSGRRHRKVTFAVVSSSRIANRSACAAHLEPKVPWDRSRSRLAQVCDKTGWVHSLILV